MENVIQNIILNAIYDIAWKPSFKIMAISSHFNVVVYYRTNTQIPRGGNYSQGKAPLLCRYLEISKKLGILVAVSKFFLGQ
jgi:hypothetical protein